MAKLSPMMCRGVMTWVKAAWVRSWAAQMMAMSAISWRRDMGGLGRGSGPFGSVRVASELLECLSSSGPAMVVVELKDLTE